MSFQEKNIAVTLANFSLILIYFLARIGYMWATDTFEAGAVFRLWGIIIVLAIVVTILATILTHIVSAIIEAIRTGTDNPDIEDIQDERDQIIDLRGTKATYGVSSVGVALAMLTYVLDQPPLVMFSLLIFFGVVAQIVGDTTRLILYRRGF